MLMPDAAFVRTLLSRYADLQMRHVERPSRETRAQLDDVTYTLCVCTGTRTIRDALAAADQVLAQAAARTDGASHAA
ncbi:DUF5133 domain-containing protein [Streptomyces sp. VRA16 Mangrove soil]|uniref:DUF5133 domain-containing protein n=1 Tax=Streptomyces sp. VRA16 Mangrove soil TaxID=2817434 RepID=UPI001A9EEB82|nr:DUF5133 domain-containing protein [Streptomyces sp. VRA16 Mangrove soil]MBO1332828.1 DUF5133 domain-containing protein [Streptomyces sp. VRA16 Mangrove soil]